MQMPAHVRDGHTSSIFRWSMHAALGAISLTAGAIMLGSAPVVGVFYVTGRTLPMVNIFNVLGLGLFWYYVTAVSEVSAAIALLLPSTARYAAWFLIPTMILAIANQVFILHGSVVVPVVLLIAATTVAWAVQAPSATPGAPGHTADSTHGVVFLCTRAAQHVRH
jgi:hypothetical protein